MQQGCGLVTADGPPPLEGAVGDAGHTAVAVHQVGQGLVGPVVGPQIGTLVRRCGLLVAMGSGIGVHGLQTFASRSGAQEREAKDQAWDRRGDARRAEAEPVQACEGSCLPSSPSSRITKTCVTPSRRPVEVG